MSTEDLDLVRLKAQSDLAKALRNLQKEDLDVFIDFYEEYNGYTKIGEEVASLAKQGRLNRPCKHHYQVFSLLIVIVLVAVVTSIAFAFSL